MTGEMQTLPVHGRRNGGGAGPVADESSRPFYGSAATQPPALERHPIHALPEQNGNTTEWAVGLMHTFVMMIEVSIDSEYILLTRRGIQNHQKHTSYRMFIW